jgi:UDP-3-O-[3-hydroxymyristoyl] N-acetylglucosamine deacetylase
MKLIKKQTTIKRNIKIEGIGLHTGAPARVEMTPAADNTGIMFVRADTHPPVMIKADSSNILATDHATTIGKGNTKISTIEHLMAAVYALGINNIIIRVYGPEVPVMDGSSRPFVDALTAAGIAYNSSPEITLDIKSRLSISDGDKFISIEPCRGLYVDCRIEFDHPLIQKQLFSAKITPKNFTKKICMARTFGFLKDVEAMKKHGLALGGSLENAVVIDNDRIINSEGLRSPDEFVKHKVLDLIGDIALSGFRINGRIKAVKTGHEMHSRLVQKIMATPSAWELSNGIDEKRPLPSWINTNGRRVAVAV